jgi:hypothetical protein
MSLSVHLGGADARADSNSEQVLSGLSLIKLENMTLLMH